jgi:hypothetical protein
MEVFIIIECVPTGKFQTYYGQEQYSLLLRYASAQSTVTNLQCLSCTSQ